MWQAGQTVFRRPGYAVLALLVAWLMLTGFLLLPNLGLITAMLGATETAVLAKLTFLASLYGTLLSNYTLIGAAYVLVVVALMSVNIALLVFYLRHRVQAAGGRVSATASFVGLVTALFGVGCVACGSVLLVGLLSLFGAGGVVYMLAPLGPLFAIIGLGLLVGSNWYLLRQIASPAVCPMVTAEA